MNRLPNFIRPVLSCVNLTTYVQGMSDYELMCYISQHFTEITNKINEIVDYDNELAKSVAALTDYINKLSGSLQDEVNNWLDEAYNSGKIQAIIGSVTGFVNVRSLGFIGDGSKHDTELLQNIVTNNRFILIPPGEYAISNAINVPSDTYMYGAGATIKTKGYTIFNIDNSSRVYIKGVKFASDYKLFKIENYDNNSGEFTISRQLKGEPPTVGDVYTTSSLNFETSPNLPRFMTTSVTTTGVITTHEDFGAYNGVTTNLYPMYLGEFSWDCELISAENSSYFTIENCVFDSAGYAIHAPNSSNVTLIDSVFECALDCVLIGDQRNDCYNFSFIRCRFTNYDYGKQGVIAYNFKETPANGFLYNVSFDSCNFDTISETGISFSYLAGRVKNVSIENCNFKNNFLHAVSLVCEESTIKNCVFSSSLYHYRTDCVFGYPLGYVDESIVKSSNVIVGCSFINTYGVSCGSNNDGVKTSLSVRDCYFSSVSDNRLNINILQNSDVTFQNSDILDSQPNSVLHNRWSYYISGDVNFIKCHLGSLFYPDTSVSSNVTVIDCNIDDISYITSNKLTVLNSRISTITNYTTGTQTKLINNYVGNDKLGDVVGSNLIYSGNGQWKYGTTTLPKLFITSSVTSPAPSQYEKTDSPATIGVDGVRFGNNLLDYGSSGELSLLSENLTINRGYWYHNNKSTIYMASITSTGEISQFANLFSCGDYRASRVCMAFGISSTGEAVVFSTPQNTSIVQNSTVIAADTTIYIIGVIV